MPAENMSTREVADYLGINEKQVYALIKAKSIPCTRVTGKWVFPKRLIDRWITTSALKEGPVIDESARSASEDLFAAGSNDPVLDIVINHMKNGDPGTHIFSSVTGSTEGLRLLGTGLTDIAWCHLANPVTGEYDLDMLASLIPHKKIAIVHLFQRELGFLLPPDSKEKTMNFSIIAENKLRFVNRQGGSGTRVVTDKILAEENINRESIDGYISEVNTHLEVGLMIINGECHTGIATSAIAKILGLKFIPLIKENFDMVVLQETFFRDEVQNFIETLNSDSFRKMVSHLGNYDFNRSGKIIFSTP
ncbi:MAG TPA: helix-turn-helix transcriptional regulator [Spirochaetota bacterium]|nr:helix-turn-helix transcriptional regulator [Spirochaetota bacterium]HPF06757.1 helix-turn-helix transcriptional regulator [Spirochaetota bacterium]HPJ41723.1 helix-turn-helix transcriptional regulator [Spirochaetota bacterium]HPR36633.1 helix-turn-helix transcriptional regulator [Spirochaetota bacterium]HRX47698.1 helix-turn-helix transcriptional regulator [Spirochaetota bacterium]